MFVWIMIKMQWFKMQIWIKNALSIYLSIYHNNNNNNKT